MAAQLLKIKTVLVANRGEIAVRCIRACQSLDVRSVAIYTASDATSLHVALANESVLLTQDGVAGYLNIDEILTICARHNIDAVLPGYGFLSENTAFARRVAQAGMVFAGPSPASIAAMGEKHRARELAHAVGVPTIPGTGLLGSEADALAAAEELTYPVMLKATAGGGGIGLEICHSAADVRAALARVQSRGEKLFKNAGVLLEKYFPRSRHIEVQVFGNGEEVVHFGERECSIQRRHQKVIEECPSLFVQARPGLRQKLTRCAIKYASALHYKSAGTVEFLVDNDTGAFFFLEMNTRLQVEHGVTELCYGMDLVALMLRQADAERAGFCGIPTSELTGMQKYGPEGAAVEVRVYAEDPYSNFAPSPGLFQEVRWPEGDGVRVDTWVRPGQHISTLYDPLLAKVIVHAATRATAVTKILELCRREIVLKGPTTNLGFLGAILASEPFNDGNTLTNFLDTQFSHRPTGIDVQSPGAYSTIQDFPGRPSLGYGIPKGGPMDNISMRIANMLVENPPGMETIECTLLGPELLFTAGAVVSVCGAECTVLVDGEARPMWSSLLIEAGQTLKIGAVQGPGCRMYIAVRGGFPNIPTVFGSKSTAPGLNFGGYQGRPLRPGDFLDLTATCADVSAKAVKFTLPGNLRPSMEVHEVYAMQGPHDSDEIMTPEGRDVLYNAEWTVGHNSGRTGVTLSGPSPKWARKSGGAAGSHPSNYLDYGYPSPGGMNWGGDSPVIFTADSPNFGGLVCSATVVSADLWKLGQLKPGDRFRLTPASLEDAVNQIIRVDRYLESVSRAISERHLEAAPINLRIPRANVLSDRSILRSSFAAGTGVNVQQPRVVYRQGGERFLLVEFGSEKTSVAIIARIKMLLDRLRGGHPDLHLLLTPHVGSLTIEYNPTEISQAELLKIVSEAESSIGTSMDMSIPCRSVRLPLVFDHPALRACTERYIATVRDEAAYLPDNIEYIRAANGLPSRRAVFDHFLSTEYLVTAVGFLAGMPMLFPLTPQAITAQKYNPTRSSTPGGTIGLGGSLLSLYPVESPGGYMMAARTLEMWDAFGTKPGFAPGKPWLMELFDHVRFYEVGEEEYDKLTRDFAAGKYKWGIEPSVFAVREETDKFERARKDPQVVAWLERQGRALAEQEAKEKRLFAQWKAGQSEEIRDVAIDFDDENTVAIPSPLNAVLWKLSIKQGDMLGEGQVVAILESMKMEVNVVAPNVAEGFIVQSVVKREGNTVNAGDVLVVAKKADKQVN